MSTDRTFHYYLPEKVIGDSLLQIRAALR
jgi:hypothetical protein